MKETRDHATLEASSHTAAHAGAHGELSNGEIFTLTSFRDKSLSSVSQAGMVNNLNDGLAWGLFPLRASALKRSASSPPSTPPPGAPRNSSPEPRRTDTGGNG